MAIADALAAQVKHLDADVVQLDEANLPGSPEEWEWAAAAINRVLDAVKTTPAVHLCFGNYGGQTSEGHLGAADGLSQCAACRSCRDGVRAPATGGARGLQALCSPEIGFGLGVVDIKATEIEIADQVARAIERAEKTARRGPGEVYPSGLRLLDAEAHDRRRKDPRLGKGAEPSSRIACVKLNYAGVSCHPGHRELRAITPGTDAGTANGIPEPRGGAINDRTFRQGSII